MRISRSSASVLFSILYALFAQAAILPTTLSLRNGTLLGLPVVSVPGTPPAAGLPPIAVSTRNIILAFIERGRPIPEDEVRETLIDADQAIADLSTHHPTQRITNDRFEYRRPNGNMLISIMVSSGEEITWKELARILQGLYQYMTAGWGAEETHYQALEFEVEARGNERTNIGYGVVWYLGPQGNEVQKRARLSLPNLTSPRPSNETTRQLPNTSLVLPVAGDEPTVFSIPKTGLSLSFYFFGPSIPARRVEATIQGAMAMVRPLLNGPSENDPVEDDAFRWILPLGSEAGFPVAVTVFAYHGHKISWRQLFDVLFGLFAFTTTFGTDLRKSHYQVLGFRILDDQTLMRLGVGTLSYFRSGTDQLAKRAGTIDHQPFLRRPSAPNVLSLDTVSVPIPYQIANTDITLTFTYLGDTPIPPLDIKAALIVARERIFTSVRSTPDSEIPERYRDISIGNRVSTNVIIYRDKFVTWKELDQTLKGIMQFCHDDEVHDRVLVFEIDIAKENRGRVGFGTLLYVPPDLINVTTL